MSKVGTYKVNGIPLAEKITAGNALFVDSNTGVNEITSYGSRPDRPVATIDYAINNATSGDTIYVLERHAESIGSTVALVPDVPKISIVGLGSENKRPVISTATGTSGANASIIGITGAGTSIENITFRSGQAAGSSGNLIRVGADDVLIKGCRFDHNTTAVYFVNTIELPSGSDRVTIKDCVFTNTGTTGQAQKAIDLSGTAVTFHINISNNIFHGCWDTSIIKGTTDNAQVGLSIRDNLIYNNSTIGTDTCINLPSSATIGKGGRGNFITGNTVFSGSSAAATQLFIVPWMKGGNNKFHSSTGGKFSPSAFTS